MTAGRQEARCGACRHFRNDPALLEAAFPGLASLGSAWGSARAEDGLCLRRECFLSASAWCGEYAERAPEC